MVMEYSADTYDWERIHERGKRHIDTLEFLSGMPDGDEMHAVINRVDELLASNYDTDNYRRLDANDGTCVQFEIPAGDEAWRTYDLTIRITDDARVRAHFEMSPDSLDGTHTIFDGHASNFNPSSARLMLHHAFEITRNAIDTSRETLLSQREAEVFLLKNEDLSDDEVLHLTDIPNKSNLTTYKSRIEDRISEARNQKETAEATLDLLADSWVDDES